MISSIAVLTEPLQHEWIFSRRITPDVCLTKLSEVDLMSLMVLQTSLHDATQFTHTYACTHMHAHTDCSH